MRSTKAGGRTPATRRRPVAPSPWPRALNEGRGSNPGDTHRHEVTHAPILLRSTKAGGRTPATPAPPYLRAARRSPLNEGRGSNPGDTSRSWTTPWDHCVRSTKAGGRTPATPPLGESADGSTGSAQRRPGVEPRRHAPPSPAASAPFNAQRRPGVEPRRHIGEDGVVDYHAARSTKAGGRTPATLIVQTHLAGGRDRSTKAGGRTPATPPPGFDLTGHYVRSTKAGGRTPATPRWPTARIRASSPRSTKAGGRTPATRRGAPTKPRELGSLNEGRGSNPGDTSSASAASPLSLTATQRRPGVEPRRHPRHVAQVGGIVGRSTKAGGRTPATRNPRLRPSRRPTPLNEGRGSNPGDTTKSPTVAPEGMIAQRRPGVEPRRHQLWTPTTSSGPRHAQRRPGVEPRRHPLHVRRRVRPYCRSTKAGGRTPATPGHADKCAATHHALNEGRGSNPGDTSPSRRPSATSSTRSTKAGGRTPATPDGSAQSDHALHRSTKAGGRTPATPGELAS